MNSFVQGQRSPQSTPASFASHVALMIEIWSTDRKVVSAFSLRPNLVHNLKCSKGPNGWILPCPGGGTAVQPSCVNTNTNAARQFLMAEGTTAAAGSIGRLQCKDGGDGKGVDRVMCE